MIIRRHGYDPDIEIKGHVNLTIEENEITAYWVGDNEDHHEEKIQEVQREPFSNNIILFTSENW